MNYMTLQEVCVSTGVSRRAIQGYEKIKLVSATGKTERGHLLYNEEAQNRIRQIKFYQQLGFALKEIGAIIDAPSEILRIALEKRIKELEKHSKETEVLLQKAYDFMETL